MRSSLVFSLEKLHYDAFKGNDLMQYSIMSGVHRKNSSQTCIVSPFTPNLYLIMRFLRGIEQPCGDACL